MKRVNVNQAEQSVSQLESFRTRTFTSDGLWGVRLSEDDPGLRCMGAGQLPTAWVPEYEKALDNGIEYAVFSYRTPIAWVVKNHDPQAPAWSIVIPDAKYSPTTSGHQNTAKYGLQKFFGMDDYRVYLVAAPPSEA